MIRHGKAPFLECSSKGDKRFSAFYARVEKYNNRTIEEVYQASKIFEDGTTGLNWREAKGKRPVNIKEVRALYSKLWNVYFKENPELVPIILRTTGVSDIFGQHGSACQATEIGRIRQMYKLQELGD